MTLRELDAKHQEHLAFQQGVRTFVSAFLGDKVATAYFANCAVINAENAWRMRNPEPMMVEVHKFFLRRNGCNVDFNPMKGVGVNGATSI